MCHIIIAICTGLESGKVKECGNHQSLMEAKGGYAVLYRRQKELEKGYVEVSA